MILYCVAFIFKRTNNKPESIIRMVLSVSYQSE